MSDTVQRPSTMNDYPLRLTPDYDALDFGMLGDADLEEMLRDAQRLRETGLIARVRRELHERQAAPAAGGGGGMSETTRDLDVQIAQRLFGWQWLESAQLWRDPGGLLWQGEAFRRRLPAYSTDPAATALVWQWLEGQVKALEQTGMTLSLASTAQGGWTYLCFLPGVEAQGASWPEALCLAALALAEALEGEKP